jgi:hypothetical protein
LALTPEVKAARNSVAGQPAGQQLEFHSQKLRMAGSWVFPGMSPKSDVRSGFAF